jgi:hypothetical protein
MMSPTRSVPRCTSTVPTGPRPRSSFASMTTPSASGPVGLQVQQLGLQLDCFQQLVRSRSSAGRYRHLERFARHALDDDLVLQQVRAHTIGIGVGLSILLIATINGTPPLWHG